MQRCDGFRSTGFAEGFFENLNGTADAEEGIPQVGLLGFQVCQHFLSGFVFGFELLEALLEFFLHGLKRRIFEGNGRGC